MLFDAIFSPQILFFFLLKGVWLRGRKKKTFFFLVLTITLGIVVHLLDPQSKGQGFKYVEFDDAIKRVIRLFV